MEKRQANRGAEAKVGPGAAAVVVVEVPGVLAFVRNVVKKRPMKWGNHVRIKNARNVEPI
jgi:hypothetical protein